LQSLEITALYLSNFYLSNFCQRLNTLRTKDFTQRSSAFPDCHFLQVCLKCPSGRVHRLRNISTKPCSFTAVGTFSHRLLSLDLIVSAQNFTTNFV